MENGKTFFPFGADCGSLQQYAHSPRFPLRPFSIAEKRQSPEIE